MDELDLAFERLERVCAEWERSRTERRADSEIASVLARWFWGPR